MAHRENLELSSPVHKNYVQYLLNFVLIHVRHCISIWKQSLV